MVESLSPDLIAAKSNPCPNPDVQKLIDVTDAEYDNMINCAKNYDTLWCYQPEMDLLHIYGSRFCFDFNVKFCLTFSCCEEKEMIYNIVSNTLTVFNGWQPFDFKTVLSDRFLISEN